VAGLSDAERDCLARYCALIGERVAVEEVRMFGSAARGDMWPPQSPMHSDIDLLVVTHDDVPEPVRQELIDATYPLYLECGRQLSPHFFSRRRLADPGDDRTRAFLREVRADGVVVWAP
jgi:predicted nucleotidyltransferase